MIAASQQQETTFRPALWLPILPPVLLAGFPLIPWIRANLRLAASFWIASGALLVFALLLRGRVGREERVLRLEFVPRPVHYIQTAMHTSIFVYWGWYWREVYHYAPLILAQVVFVYGLDMLVSWSRRGSWIMGFGPFPIVFSTNLFLWFKDDWFFLQFLLVATGVLCKEFVTWKRDGRRAHIFNPSAIALAIFSAGLLVTNSTHITWGEEVAVTLGRPPHMYLEIFLAGLIVQALFSVTLVTLAAAAALYVLNLLYTGSTGVYYFVDTNIPIAVFLGLHLLVTDPATSPRKNLGKLLFGAMYGTAVFGLYSLLGSLGMPTFYDKLLAVPPLNLLVQGLDRVAAAAGSRLTSWRQNSMRWYEGWTPRRANLAHMAVWSALFGVMLGTGFVGGRHPGSNPDFWRQACLEGRRNACETWVHTTELICAHGSAHACLALGTELDEGRLVATDVYKAARELGRACDLGEVAGCVRLIALVGRNGPGVFERGCDSGDGETCYMLGALYHAGRGVPLDEGRALSLFRRSCDSGWWRGCGRVAESYRAGEGTAADPGQAIAYFEKACRAGYAASCFSVAAMYHARNAENLARLRIRQGCEYSARHADDAAAYFRPGAELRTGKAPAFCAEGAR
jgi:Sel1 repeat